MRICDATNIDTVYPTTKIITCRGRIMHEVRRRWSGLRSSNWLKERQRRGVGSPHLAVVLLNASPVADAVVLGPD